MTEFRRKNFERDIALSDARSHAGRAEQLERDRKKSQKGRGIQAEPAYTIRGNTNGKFRELFGEEL